MSTEPYPTTPRSELRRLPERGSADRATVHAILDAGMICHVGLATPRGPVVIPTIYARDGETLYLHGSPASRMLRDLAKGVPVCVTVTHVDGVVFARSAFHHSLNYRSVVAFGTARAVEDPARKEHALRRIVEHVAPGRSAHTRAPNDFERTFTRVLAVEIEEATAKVRSGGPKDDAEDLALPYWAGVVPLRTEAGAAIPAPDLAVPPEPPEHVLRWSGPGSTTC